MRSPDTQTPILYINGLGDGAKDKLIMWWWKRASADFRHAQVNWYDGTSFDDWVAEIVGQADELIKQFGCVAIIGSSAGGSLAVNAFFQLRDKNICVVNAHGRLHAGNYTDGSRNSLYHRAHLDTDQPSQSFFDSVTHAENETLPNITDNDKAQILVLSQLTDLVVPTELLSIDGV